MRKVLIAFVALVLFSVPVYGGVLIPWEFEVYESADFSSDVVARHEAGSVTILRHGENDWVEIESGWVNMRYSPAVRVLDDFFSQLGNNVAVFYMNLDTGFTYIHNPNRSFFAASLSKSNHALYVYTLAERGLIDMHKIHTYTRDDFWGGTGIMRFMAYGLEFTTRELLGLSIRESDNAAYRMLIRHTRDIPFSYRDFVTEIGADTQMIRDVISQNTNIRDAGLWMRNIYDYIEGDNQYGHYLRHDMLNTAQTSHPHFTRWEGSNGVGGDVDIRMIQTDYPLARKYGWARNAFHDAGIIYAPSPFILVILSNMERGAHELFAEISRFTENFNHRTFVSPSLLNAPIQGPSVHSGRISPNLFVYEEAQPAFLEVDYFENTSVENKFFDMFSGVEPKIYGIPRPR